MLAVNCIYSVPGYISGKDLYLPEIAFVFSVTHQTLRVCRGLTQLAGSLKVHFLGGFAAAYPEHSFRCGQLSLYMH